MPCSICILHLCRRKQQTARQFARLIELTGKTYYSAWRRDLQLLIHMIKLLVFTIVTTDMLDISEEISQFEMSHKLLVRMLYYVIDLAGCISEHQFVVFMHYSNVLFTIGITISMLLSENDDVTNVPWYRNERNRKKLALFIVSNNSLTSKREKSTPI